MNNSAVGMLCLISRKNCEGKVLLLSLNWVQNQTGVYGVRGENFEATLRRTLAKIYVNMICDIRLVQLAHSFLLTQSLLGKPLPRGIHSQKVFHSLKRHFSENYLFGKGERDERDNRPWIVCSGYLNYRI